MCLPSASGRCGSCAALVRRRSSSRRTPPAPPTPTSTARPSASRSRPTATTRKVFGIPLQAPWDRAYRGRLDDKLPPNDPIVPRGVTAPREAAMGPATLVVAAAARELVEKPRRPLQRGGLPPHPLPPAGETPT